ISCEPTDEVAVVITASGIQGAPSALLGRAHFPSARPTSTGAFAAMLTERGYTVDVGHQRHKNEEVSRLRRVPRARNMHTREFLPPIKELFFRKIEISAHKVRICHARRDQSPPRNFWTPPRRFEMTVILSGYLH